MNDHDPAARDPGPDEEPSSEDQAEETDERPDEGPPTAETQEQPTGPRRLLRSRDDRMIVGVAGGLGAYFGVDPLIFRIGFGVSVFFGGLGILAYLALALFVPSVEGAGVRPAPVQRSRTLAVVVGIVAVIAALSAFGSGFFWDGPGWGFAWLAVLAAAGGCAYLFLRDRETPVSVGRLLAVAGLTVLITAGVITLGVLSAWATAEGLGLVMAGIVMLIAIALVVTALTVGGARWLIIPALAIAIPAGIAAAADFSLEGGYGKRVYEPATAAEIPADGYELAMGQLVVDLRELDWERGAINEVQVDLGFGEAVIAVPDGVCVEADARAAVGALDVGGGEVGGIGVDETLGVGSVQTPRLVLDGDVDAGLIRVVTGDEVVLRGDHDDWFDHGRNFNDATRAAACVT